MQADIPLRPILVRAGLVALGLGLVLNLVNHGPALARGDAALLPAILFFTTPFFTVVVSQFLGIRAARRDAFQARSSHPLPGILLRAAVLGLVLASTNIMLIVSLSAVSGHAVTLPLSLILQSFTLPTAFSVPAQLIAYRRQRKALATV